MAQSRRSLVLRMLNRLLVPGRGEVRAMEEALHLQGVMRFIGLFAATVVLPSLVLAWLGLGSIQVDERQIVTEAEREATAAADAFWTDTDRSLSAFEDAVFHRLEAGRSPLQGRGELHAHLLVALRFDQDGRLVAPFAQSAGEVVATVEQEFDPTLQAALSAERAGEFTRAEALYRQVSTQARGTGAQGRALFDAARMQQAAGDLAGADAQLGRVIERYETVRDPWGFRLGDLARLERARTELARDPVAGTRALRRLVDTLLDETWTVGHGGEAAIARRALSLSEPTGDREWAAVARGRVAERTAMLFYTGKLMEELHQVALEAGDLRVGAGSLSWRAGEDGLWATTWWGGQFYVFGLDRHAVLDQLKADARGSVRPDAAVVAWLLGPEEALPDDLLARRRLAPWLTGWSLVVVPRDAGAIDAARTRKRNQRIGFVSIAVLLIGAGVILSARLITRELDVARMQTDFAANVSHELRSPITQIRLKGEELLIGLAETEEEREHSYQVIVRESERLSRLVDNVLDFAAIERGNKRYALRPGDIADTVLRSVDSIASAQEVADKVLDIDLPPDLPMVFHDPDAIAQCVINLVSNAAKYSEQGAWIGIQGRVVTSGVEIAVSDKGIGIAPHDMQRIFEPFFRSRDSLARRRKGTGIGLTITRYIMRAHGGDVSVQSRPGKGSSFILRFPEEPPEAPPATTG